MNFEDLFYMNLQDYDHRNYHLREEFGIKITDDKQEVVDIVAKTLSFEDSTVVVHFVINGIPGITERTLRSSDVHDMLSDDIGIKVNFRSEANRKEASVDLLVKREYASESLKYWDSEGDGSSLTSRADLKSDDFWKNL